jgi:hypothetical protein
MENEESQEQEKEVTKKTKYKSKNKVVATLTQENNDETNIIVRKGNIILSFDD